ncbi:hypothetical protein HYPSUDRAFT_33119 [Hypholoma sublateritium FD-334 SS-4]|uniref:F-box domain-containing protein n=1 Tax=Hypholoma sublateritium (strain FD-334 SS-4) TaxID=945553 RepID=A0A0D2QAV3_HYPSF|nr:hypothetical protein HYPSUDRAFT_33119 [Hypholoma sublateritium FD-334 SS-4]
MTLQSHRALETPELLNIIFGLLDHQSNVANVQVCKFWFNVALDILWRDVYDVRQLFAILSPLKGVLNRDGGFEYEFKRSPRTSDWKRFEKYASHVRRLVYYNNPSLKKSVLDELAHTRRQLEIFPNLQTLNWCSSVNSGTLFMHNSVQKFVLHIGDRFPSSFEEVVDRMPNLSRLHLDTAVPARIIEEDLTNMLQQLPNIRKITLPHFYSTARIIEALSRLPLLNTIKSKIDAGYGDSLDTASFKPIMTAGAFPALHDLSLMTNFDDIASFVQSPFSPSTLTHFRIQSDLVEMPDSIHRLASEVSKRFQELKTLRIESIRDYSFERDYTIEDFADTDCDGHNITLETLKHLFELRYLTSFEIHHQYPLHITQQDIETIAFSCPALENLRLCTEPGFCMKSTLTLAALVPLAQHCTKLKSLGLFMDATIVPTMSPTMPSFTSLYILFVGLSIIDDETPMVYLSQLIPPECVIDAFDPCGSFLRWDDDLRCIASGRSWLWDRVGSLARKLSSVRVQEGLRTRALERAGEFAGTPGSSKGPGN